MRPLHIEFKQDHAPDPDAEPRRSRVPKGMEYCSHTGSRQRQRYFRQQCAAILNSKDPAVLEQLEAARVRSSTEAASEFCFLFLVNRGRDVAADNDMPWAEAMGLMLATLEEAIKEPV